MELTYPDSNGSLDGKLITHYLRMVLVGKQSDPLEGENGYAPTTWMSKNVLTLSDFKVTIDKVEHSCLRNSGIDKWWAIEYYFFQQDYFLSKEIKDYLRPVIKYTRYPHDGILWNDYPLVSRICIPSYHELIGLNDYETLGADYSKNIDFTNWFYSDNDVNLQTLEIIQCRTRVSGLAFPSYYNSGTASVRILPDKTIATHQDTTNYSQSPLMFCL